MKLQLDSPRQSSKAKKPCLQPKTELDSSENLQTQQPHHQVVPTPSPEMSINTAHIKEDITHLEASFKLIAAKVRKKIMSSSETISLFCDVIKEALPQPIQGLKVHIEYTSLEQQIVSEFFHSLEYIYTFIDYELLEFIINIFGNEELKQQFRDYEQNLKIFCEQTTIMEFITCWEPRFDIEDIPEDLIKCVTRMPWDSRTTKLEELKEIKKHLLKAVRQERARAAFYMKEICSSSVTVTWIVWTNNPPLVLKSLINVEANIKFLGQINIYHMEVITKNQSSSKDMIFSKQHYSEDNPAAASSPKDSHIPSISPDIKSEQNPIVVMVAGQPRKGKSTALNNIFGLDYESRASANSVTTRFIPKSVIRGGQELVVIDTPGIGALDLDASHVLKEIQKYITGLDFTLIYCLAVNSSNPLNDTEEQVIELLHRYLHKGIWKKSIILLTFSDRAREDGFPYADKQYIHYLQEYTSMFEELLNKNGVDLQVKTIFDYQSEKERMNNTLDGIVAIPVAKERKEYKIMPGFHLNRDLDWTDIVFHELLKRVNPADRLDFIDFKYATPTAGDVMASAAAGASIGAGLGVVGGPIGMGLGAIIGGITGAASSTSVSSYFRFITWKKANPDIKIRELIAMTEKSEKD